MGWIGNPEKQLATIIADQEDELAMLDDNLKENARMQGEILTQKQEVLKGLRETRSILNKLEGER